MNFGMNTDHFFFSDLSRWEIPDDIKAVISEIDEFGDIQLSLNELNTIENAVDFLYNHPIEVCSNYILLHERRQYTMPIVYRLLKARKSLINRNFAMDRKTFDKLENINACLSDMTAELKRKMQVVYQQWFATEATDWGHDCNVEGTISMDGINQDIHPTVRSDYKTIAPILEAVETKPFFELMFSGSKNTPFPQYISEPEEAPLPLNHCFPNQYGDFPCCRAFEYLLRNTIFSVPDILRIESFFVEVNMVYQNIVDIGSIKNTKQIVKTLSADDTFI